MKTALIEKSIKEALETKFQEEDFNDCYMVEVKITQGNKVTAYVDSDGQLTLGRCQKISRFLEKQIEENDWLGEKYTLDVSSPGLDRPIVALRQYIKNIGRNIRITNTAGEVLEGKMTHADESGIHILEKLKKEEKQHELQYDNITEAKILVSFK